jgi:predicted amidohydrolase
MAIAWGFVEKDAGTSKLYNSQALVLPNGRYTTYAKVNRWGQDFIWASKGTASPPVIDYLGKKVGLLICRDVRDKSPALDDFYEPGDANIVAFSTNWGDGGFPSNNWVSFAMNNKVWLIVANRYGREANNDFGEGGPCIISPKGEVHCEGLVWSQPCIVYAEV